MIRSVLHSWSVTLLVAFAVTLCAVGGCEQSPQDLTEPTDTRAAQAGDDVETRVKEIVGQQFGRDAKELKLSDRFVADLSGDQLDAIELLVALEDGFDVSISVEAMDKLISINDAVVYIRRHRRKTEGQAEQPSQTGN